MIRKWQKEALRDFLSSIEVGKKCRRLVVAPPGAGKTHFCYYVINKVMEMGLARRFIVVGPTRQVVSQWSSTGKTHKKRVLVSPKSNSWVKRGHGCAVTYSQISMNPSRFIAPAKDAIVILDEVHHAGSGMKWGEGLVTAFQDAPFILSTSGTPFREDNKKIPFINYADEISKPDFSYPYGRALSDGVIRPVVFCIYDGVGESVFFGKDEKKRFNLSKFADPKSGWIEHVFGDADNMIDKLRADGHHNAGGLIVCKDIDHARRVCKMIKDITGNAPVMVSSDDSSSTKRINEFADSSDRWIVSVNMISEGVDIPRLRVSIYATNIATNMFFRQFVGRIVRVTSNQTQISYCYIPDDYRIVEMARKLDEEQNHVISNIKPYDEWEKANGNGLISDVPLPKDEVTQIDNIHCNWAVVGGQMVLFPDYVPKSALKVVQAVEPHILSPVADPVESEPHVDESDIKGEIRRNVGIYASRNNCDFSRVYGMLNNKQGVRSQSDLSFRMLVERLSIIKSWN